MDQSISPSARSLGKESQQLSGSFVFRLRNHLVAQVRGLEIDSKWMAVKQQATLTLAMVPFVCTPQ